MGADAWITLAVIAVLCVVFISERLPATLAMGGAVSVLYLSGVLDVGQAFGGFANIAPLTIAALYVIAGAADITGALGGITNRIFRPGFAGSERRALARTVLPASAVSGFLPNTPLVAMFAPRISAWARRTGRSPSRFLIPLSYAAILGGVITVLGTSTNLIISGLLDDAGQEPLGIFEITPVGLPLALVGTVAIVALAPLLVPTRRAPDEDLGSVREFTVEMIVSADSPLAGRTVAEGSLRSLQGVYLVEILRGGRTLAPVAPDEVLEGNDRLVFAGAVDKVVDLQGLPGLVMAEEHHVTVTGDIGHRFYEVVVSEASVLNGSTLKESEFRGSFGAAVVAVHRGGERLGGKLGDLPLRAGDVLLVVATEGFDRTARNRGDFSVVATMDAPPPVRRRSARLVELAVLALVVLAASGVVDLTRAAMGVALALLVLRVVTPGEARRSINFDIVAMVAFSIGIGRAAHESGLAETMADAIIGTSSHWGDLGIVLGIAIATIIATELLSNAAAAALMFPIAAATALETGMELRPLAVVVLLLASCSFLTPIGYQTNTMVFGMGGYRFTDFSRLGIPLTLIALVVAVVAVPLAFPLR